MGVKIHFLMCFGLNEAIATVVKETDNVSTRARTRFLHDPTPHVPKVMELAFDDLHYPIERIFQGIARACGPEGFAREGEQDTGLIATAPMPLTLHERDPRVQDVM